MFTYSKASLDRLATCDKRLQDVFNEVIKYRDTIILEGHRNQLDQEAAFNGGHTTLHYPFGKHNAMPSLAVDAGPAPLDWKDRERWSVFVGQVMQIAAEKGIKLRWGGDWNNNTFTKDTKLSDLPHFEVVE